VQALQERQQRLTAEVDALRLRLQSEAAAEQQLGHELEILRAEEAEIPGRVAELQRTIAQEEARAAEEAGAAAGALAQVRQHTDALATELRMLEETLGLRIEQIPEHSLLRFTFVFVDPREPTRPFQFSLQLVGEATYVVHECTPPVAELQGLLDELNQNPTLFYAFVRGMRKAFKRSIGLPA